MIHTDNLENCIHVEQGEANSFFLQDDYIHLPTHPQGGGPAKPAVLVGQSEANVSLNWVEIAAAAPLAVGHCDTPGKRETNFRDFFIVEQRKRDNF
jgi:hypothetical protein